MSDVRGAITIFAALEPDAELSALVQGYKDETRALVGEQVYLDDPPHLTVYLAIVPSAFAAPAEWPRIAARGDDLRVSVTGWHVFESDALTGNHTLVCGIAAEDKQRLRAFQRDVVGALAPVHDPVATRARYAPRWQFLTSDQRALVERHGSPFVGDGWEPHFTIASVRPADWNKVWTALQPRPPRGQFRCARCRLYELADGKWNALDGLGGPA